MLGEGEIESNKLTDEFVKIKLNNAPFDPSLFPTYIKVHQQSVNKKRNRTLRRNESAKRKSCNDW